MHPYIIKSRHWLTQDIRRIAVAISVLLSIWSFANNDTINSDGILYLDAAYQMTLGNWKEAYEIYYWPFLSLLIAGLSFVTPLDVVASATILNIVFYAALIWLFLTLLIHLGAKTQVLVAGCIVILIHPYINDYRADILRGPGMWISLLAATIFLIHLRESQHRIYAIAFSASLLIGTLFRIEALAFLFLMPLILLTDQEVNLAQRIKSTAACYALPAAMGLLTIIYLILSDKDVATGRLLEPSQYLFNFISGMTNEIPMKAELLATHVLNQYSEDFAIQGIYAILIAIVVTTIIKRATLVYLLFTTYQLIKKNLPLKPWHADLLIWTALINIAYLCLYVVVQFFLSSRFAVPISLIVALFASFGLANLFYHYCEYGFNRAMTTLILLSFLVMALDGLVSFGTSKDYLRHGGEWLKENMLESDRLYTNHLVINHYADRRYTIEERREHITFGREISTDILRSDNLSNIDYLAIRTKELPPKILQKLENHPEFKRVKTFANRKKREVRIYQRTYVK